MSDDVDVDAGSEDADRAAADVDTDEAADVDTDEAADVDTDEATDVDTDEAAGTDTGTDTDKVESTVESEATAPVKSGVSVKSGVETAYLVWLPWAAVALGVALRVRNWLHDRSLWLDEILVAENIAHRNFAQLTRPLATDQAAPVGWLWVERLSINLFGVNELALRLGPLLFSVAAMIVFPVAARRLVGRAATPIATVLFACSPALIYYAAETKQYSSDATCVLLVLLATAPLMRSRPTVARVAAWAVACSALSWFSFPALAVAALCGLALAVRWIRDLRALAVLVVGGVLLGASALAENAVTLHKLSKNDTLANYWQQIGGYPPRGKGLGSDLSWLRDAGLAVMRNPVHFTAPALGLLVAAVGLIDVARWRPDAAALLGLPLGAGVALAITRHYPLSMRLAVYLIPSLVMLVAAGAVGLVTLAWQLRPSWFLAAAATIVAAALLVSTAGRPTLTGIGKFGHPDDVESGRNAIAFVAHHRQPSDLVLVESPWGTPNYVFYGARYKVRRDGGFDLRVRGCDKDPLGQLRRFGRVWLVLAHRGANEPADRNAVFLSQFEARATLVQSYQGAGDAAAYLMDFARPPAHAPVPLPVWIPGTCVSVTLS